MKSTLLTLLIGLATALMLQAAPERPNVILILSDDHAFDDHGFMGSERVNTPSLDKLANESLTYTRGYVMPVCSPTLASLLTGKLPHAHGITGNDLASMENERYGKSSRQVLTRHIVSQPLLLPEAVTQAGYLTFQTGKLWNGSYQEMGFTHGMTKMTKGGRHGDEGLRIAREGMQPIYDFIETAGKAEKPFFIWHAPFLPHTPHNPPQRLLDKYQGKGPTPAAEKYFAMVEWLDETSGELLDYLEKSQLAENTVVIYLADNGWNAKKGYEGQRGKMSPYERGIRTPMLIRWPGKVAAARDTVTLAHVTDVTKTIVEITGASDSGDLPGLNLIDRPRMKKRETIFVEAFTHDMAELANPAESLFAAVVIDGWWKLVLPGPATPKRPFATAPGGVELYHLKTDPYEANNVADQHPEVVARLKQLQQTNWNFWNP